MGKVQTSQTGVAYLIHPRQRQAARMVRSWERQRQREGSQLARCGLCVPRTARSPPRSARAPRRPLPESRPARPRWSCAAARPASRRLHSAPPPAPPSAFRSHRTCALVQSYASRSCVRALMIRTVEVLNICDCFKLSAQ